MFTRKDFIKINNKLDDLKEKLTRDDLSAWGITKMSDKIFKLQEENIKLCKTIADMTAKCEDYDRMKSQHQSLIDEIDFLYKRCNRLQLMLVDANYFIKESDNNG